MVQPRSTIKKLFYAILTILIPAILLVSGYFGFTLYLYTRPKSWLRDPNISTDPEVQSAKKECQNLSSARYDCIVQAAIVHQNPNICALTSILIDDACLDEVWRALDDPAICQQVYLENVRPLCRDYFQNHPTIDN